jgi:hypothetical protein
MGTMFAQAFATITMMFSALHRVMSAANNYAGILETTSVIQVEQTALEQEIKREENSRKIAAFKASKALTIDAQ